LMVGYVVYMEDKVKDEMGRVCCVYGG
jgi:hypothetical protein